MNNIVNYGIIGCGEIAVVNAKAIKNVENARIVHCMDAVPELAKDLAQQYNARYTTNLDELLSDKEVTAVVICTPHHLHAPIAIKSAEAGKHIMVEKPIAPNLRDADRMIESADKAGVILGVNFPWRFRFSVQKAGEILRSGVMGKILGVKLHYVQKKPDTYWHQGYSDRAKTDWRTKLALSGGGYLIMNLIHNIDYMVPLIGGSPVRIYAEYDTFATPVEVEDYVMFVMRMSNGIIFSAEGTSVVPGQESLGDRIYAEHGQIAIMWSQVRVYLEQQYKDIKAGEWVTIKPPEGTVDALVRHFQLFTQAILNRVQPPVSGREGRKALEIVRGAYLSMKRGVPIAFPVSEE